MAVKTSWSSGDVLTAADLTDTFAAKLTTPGAWTSWTPSVTNITVGNGTLRGAYSQVGKIVSCWFDFTLGSTSAVSGVPAITPPVSMKSEINGAAWTGSINDNGTTTYILWVMASSNNFNLYAMDASVSNVQFRPISNVQPMTWAVNDWMRFTATYEAA